MIEHGETLLHRSPESISDSLRSQNPRTERGKDEERERERERDETLSVPNVLER